jgi:hypothetical protein
VKDWRRNRGQRGSNPGSGLPSSGRRRQLIRVRIDIFEGNDLTEVVQRIDRDFNIDRLSTDTDEEIAEIVGQRIYRLLKDKR